MPVLLNIPTFSILAPTLLDFGTEEQKRAHLPKIISGEEMWVQFLSEPSGGSDLAGLRHPGHPRRRRLHPERLEDLELGRLPLRLRPVPGPHRLACAQAPGPDHVHRQDPPARHRRPADQDGQRLERVLPGVLRRRRHPGRERARRGQRRLDGGLAPAVPRARRRRRWLALRQRDERRPRGTTAAAGATWSSLARAAGRGSDPRVAPAGGRGAGQRRGAGLNSSGASPSPSTRAPFPVRPGRCSGCTRRPTPSAMPTSHWRSPGRAPRCGRTAIRWRRKGIDFLQRQSGSLGGGSNEMQRNIISERVLAMPREFAADKDRPFDEVLHNASPSRPR